MMMMMMMMMMIMILHRGLAAIPLSVDLWVAYLELYYKMYSTHQVSCH